jgi:hypothetical protein
VPKRPIYAIDKIAYLGLRKLTSWIRT